MKNGKKVLWIIPARAGSKGIINKNIKMLDGKPLMAHTIDTALTLSDMSAVWVSTDSEEYAKIAESYGASTPFVRPAYLATDTASTVDVVLHAMSIAMKKNKEYDAVAVLQSTSPFTRAETILSALQYLFSSDVAEAVVAVKENKPSTIFVQEDACYLEQIAKNIKEFARVDRQNFKKEITPSGGFYIAKWESFLKNKTFITEKTLAYEVTGYECLDIDEELDFLFAEFVCSRLKMNDEI